MVNKKAQLKIQQMAFMLIAVTVFFILAGMFALVFKLSLLKKDAENLEERNALLLVTKLANSPEFACGNVFDYGKADCVDADKLMVLTKNSEVYERFWGKGVSNIEVRRIYPEMDKRVVCNEGNYPNSCNVISLKSGAVNGTDVSNFVVLCRKEILEGKVQDRCEMGRLFVRYE